MSYTKPTVNERLKMLVVNQQRALEGTINNEMLTRQRVELLELEVTRLLEKCGLEPTEYEAPIEGESN